MKTTFIIFALPLLATTHYVSHTGSGTPPFDSWATATDSIGEAVAACSGGDTVRVAAGEWHELVVLPDSVALIGSGMDSTIIHRNELSALPRVITMNGYCTVQSLCVNAAHPPTLICNAIDAGGEITGWRIIDVNTIVNGAGYGGSGISMFASYDCLVSGCIFLLDDSPWGVTGVWENNIVIGPAGLISNDFCAGAYQIIRNNIIYNAPVLFGSPRDSAIITNNIAVRTFGANPTECHTNVLCENNTFCGGAHLGLEPEVIKVNNIYMNTANRFARDSLYTSYNCIWNPEVGDPDSVIGLFGNFAADPMFVEDYDFRGDTIFDVHLQYGSPCIDAGHPDPRYNDIDGSRNDIGAYGGPGGQSYLYFDLAPDIPDSFTGYGDSTHFNFSWKPNTETELSHYSLYRGPTPDFTINPTFWLADIYAPDTTYDLGPYPFGTSSYFKLTATDTAGNESQPTDAVFLTLDNIEETEVAERPTRVALMGAFPNPFNESTVIKFRLRGTGEEIVILRIFDTSGRQVRTMSGLFSPGYHEFPWNSKNDNGENLPSGMYFLRLSSGGDVALRTATILK